MNRTRSQQNKTVYRATGCSITVTVTGVWEGGAVAQRRVWLLLLGVWEKVVVGADGGMLGLVGPPSSSVRRREGLAVASTDC